MCNRHLVAALLVIGFWLLASKASDGRNSKFYIQSKEQEMVYIPAGSFWMGSDEPSFDDSQPVHRVSIDCFWLDKHEVTNEEFAKFVKETGYKTVAERCQPPRLSSPSKPFSMVFTPSKSTKTSSKNFREWWTIVPGACWSHPEGPKSNLRGRWKHPVVHVAWEDANSYAKWAKKRLPTEAEFEYAARGGLDRCLYSWGNDLKPNDRWMANIWQGNFPGSNTSADRFSFTAPVGSYPANGFGLHDMCGNVWEWCSDWYRADYFRNSPPSNPSGPDDSFDPIATRTPSKVLKGGSFMCSDQYCLRYHVGAREHSDWKSSCSNVGFRCAK